MCEIMHFFNRVFSPFEIPLQRINKGKTACFRLSLTGWGGRIRTYECSSQSAVSYRLTTPQYELVFNLDKGFGRFFAKAFFVGWKMGLEPTVSSATNWRFNQLSYIHHSAKSIITYLWVLSRKNCIYFLKNIFSDFTYLIINACKSKFTHF